MKLCKRGEWKGISHFEFVCYQYSLRSLLMQLQLLYICTHSRFLYAYSNYKSKLFGYAISRALFCCRPSMNYGICMELTKSLNVLLTSNIGDLEILLNYNFTKIFLYISFYSITNHSVLTLERCIMPNARTYTVRWFQGWRFSMTRSDATRYKNYVVVPAKLF